ncbi:MarC family protein [Methanogenium cariaci]|uniref:MarC family protein n=1 Tax=Methanogenium cariaci TaxID=2197 RepID=UPI0024805443|nr:MarC family protein [Methanogenium cariaci]
MAGGFLFYAVAVVAIICLLIIVCNLASDALMRVMGGTQGLEIVVRVFGIILLGIAVQMFAEGAGDMVTTYIHSNLTVNS